MDNATTVIAVAMAWTALLVFAGKGYFLGVREWFDTKTGSVPSAGLSGTPPSIIDVRGGGTAGPGTGNSIQIAHGAK